MWGRGPAQRKKKKKKKKYFVFPSSYAAFVALFRQLQMCHLRGVGAGNVPTERNCCRNGQFNFGKGTYTNGVPIFDK
jgi:hypothetical protein